ncbi:hypothetical protein GWK47_029643 [Chionoecetes opilio]|uniref:Reverse transcriptase domain-containing protein n=1 Tax=Chionoecetes opilio TaxID=41210 RepID=A0A8J5D5J1_CHIOP|nr:hypothetical protein GWK47_029643 [Chionoecetes opilio]
MRCSTTQSSEECQAVKFSRRYRSISWSTCPLNTGVRQGCVLAPSLFNACMDWVLDKVVDQSDCGASVGNTKITDLVFADDAVIFAESLEVLVMGWHITRMCPSTRSTWTFTSTLKRTYLYFLLLHNAFQFVHFTCKAPFQVFDRLQNSLKRRTTPFTTLSLDPSTSLNLSLLHSYHTTTLNPNTNTQHHFTLRLHNTPHNRCSHSNPES